MSRDNALNQLQSSPLTNEEIKNEKNFVANKLNITEQQLDEYFNAPNKSFKDYKSHYSIINFFTKIVQFFGIEKRVIQ